MVQRDMEIIPVNACVCALKCKILIAELVKQLYILRQNISAAVPGAGLLETPDLDDPTPFLIHPGTRAYVAYGSE